MQCDSHCHSAVNVQDGNVQGRVAVSRTLPLGVDRTAAERSRPSGSESYTATRRQSYRSRTFKAEWQCDRYARGRVAVQLTLPLGGERAGRERSGSSGSVGWDDLLCAFEKSTGAECALGGCLRSSRKGAPHVIAPRGGCRKVRFLVTPRLQNAVFRETQVAECAFP